MQGLAGKFSKKKYGSQRKKETDLLVEFQMELEILKKSVVVSHMLSYTTFIYILRSLLSLVTTLRIDK